jgi:5-methylcytosine-specific restriction endonuclease McrA
MERKGKFPCRSPVCSVFIGDHGRARRRSWTSSLGCSASTHSMALWTRRKSRRQLTTTPCTTSGRPRARIRAKVLLRDILEAPLHGRVGIDLHLGQKPKLGGGTPTIHSSIYHILSVLCISVFRFLPFLCCSCSYFYFPKHKKTKNISFVSLCLPF